MKKFLWILLCLCLVPGLAWAKEEEDPMAIYVKGQDLEILRMDRAVRDKENVEEVKNSYYIVKDNRTFLPLRSLVEELGFKVEWKQDSKEIFVEKGEDKVRMLLDSKTYWKNGEEKKMDVVPLVKNNRTYLPIRFLGEATGYKVDWDPDCKLVLIGSYQDPERIGKDGEIITKDIQLPNGGKATYSYTMPTAYKEQILEGKDHDFDAFYDRKNHENSKDFAGWIGSFQVEKQPKYIPVPHVLLGKVDGGYLCFNFVGDVQADIHNEDLVKSYEDSRKAVYEILKTVEIKKDK